MPHILAVLLSSIIFFTSSVSSAATAVPQGFILSAGATEENKTTQSIAQYGITWTFAEPVQYGQFVNGDYWVVDSGNGIKIISISPGVTTLSSGRQINGSMLNPKDMQGYDSTRDYVSAKNVGLGVSAANPLILKGNASLVSTISNETIVTNGSYVKIAAVLTCLISAPPSGSFRPGISATTKTLHNISNIDYTKLKNLTYPAGISRVDIATYTNYFRMVWLDHGGWTSRFMRPSEGIPDNYYYTTFFTEASLLLHLDYTNEEKKKLLINFIQLGIDLYSYLESGAKGWPPDGGNMNGRKWPIMFAGIMLNYAPMKNIGQKSGDYLYSVGYGPGNPPPDYIHFGEDGQTFYVRQSDIEMEDTTTWINDTEPARPGYTGELRWNGTDFSIGNMPVGSTKGPWAPDSRNDSGDKLSIHCRPYASSMLGMAEWGIRHSTAPTQSDSSWSAMYRTIRTAAYSWAGDSIAIRIMGAKDQWNHNAYFDYVDRYMAITKGAPDPFGYKVLGEVAGGRPTGLIGAMYDTYRPLF